MDQKAVYFQGSDYKTKAIYTCSLAQEKYG